MTTGMHMRSKLLKFTHYSGHNKRRILRAEYGFQILRHVLFSQVNGQ